MTATSAGPVTPCAPCVCTNGTNGCDVVVVNATGAYSTTCTNCAGGTLAWFSVDTRLASWSCGTPARSDTAATASGISVTASASEPDSRETTVCGMYESST